MGSTILLFSRSCDRSLAKHLSWPPRLLEQVLLVYYQLLRTSPFSVQLLCSQLPHKVLAVDPLLGADCTPELYCHHNSHSCIALSNILSMLRISCSSVRHFPDLSWIVEDLPCFSKLNSRCWGLAYVAGKIQSITPLPTPPLDSSWSSDISVPGLCLWWW